jgi:uncharacterized repeat protein (TIGR03803 family)
MRSFRIAQIASLLSVFCVASIAHAVITESVIHAFPAFVGDGGDAGASVIQGSDGFLYGTTAVGGAHGLGTIYKISTDGLTYQTLHSFAGGVNDGSSPLTRLFQASDGNLYGTAQLGGANNKGVLFEISTSGTGFQVFHSFGGVGDGEFPEGSITQATDGFLYGTAGDGGANSAGVLFKFALGGSNYQVVFSFGANAGDATDPVRGVFQGPDGFFYGTSFTGGANGDGTVYKIQPNGTGYQTLHSFAGGATDGINPLAGVVEAPDGFLYGTTEFGGTGGVNGEGVLFMVHPDGSNYSAFRVLSGTDGASPLGGFTVANNGKLYGATQGNGTNLDGSIFTIDQGGTNFTIVYNFGSQLNDGTDPQDSPFLAVDGKFYGTTAGGGANGQGTVYKLTTGLLTAPTGLTAIAGDTQVMLSWNAYPNAASYNVYRGTSSGGESGTPVATGLSSPSFFDTGLTNGTTYFYKVTAVVSSVETAQSSEVLAEPDTEGALHFYNPGGLQMIGVPADYTGFAPWQCFDIGNITLAVWTGTAYAITPTAPANVMVPGQAYWVKFASPAHLLDIGVDNSGAQATQIPLVAGWNMVGNPDPNNFTASLLQVKTGNTTQSIVNANKAGIIGATFYTWQSGDTAYEQIPISSGVLPAFEGFWIFAFQPCTLIFPAET